MSDEPRSGAPLLEVSGVAYSYGAIRAVHDVSLTVDVGEAVCVIGPNGAGKTTLARICGGLYRPAAGLVTIDDERLPRRAADTVSRGIASVLEGRHLFTDQSVKVNLELGAYRNGLSGTELKERLERVLTLFPSLAKRRGQRTSTLSGGEQQMVAIGRALLSAPRLLILDEPSMGLSPKIATEVFHALASLQKEGMSMLVIEQNAPLAFELAARGYLMRQGSIVSEGATGELQETDQVRAAYLGA
jgi:branched-chain amino acid transport system ATP-binding protein